MEPCLRCYLFIRFEDLGAAAEDPTAVQDVLLLRHELIVLIFEVAILDLDVEEVTPVAIADREDIFGAARIC